MSKILVIDDEEDIVTILQQRLEAEGFEVDSSYESPAGLKKIKDTKPDLVLLDVMMPQMNGFQLCRAVRADPAINNIPILMVTAKGQESDKFWGKECGASDYMVKPFEFSDLISKIRSLIQPGFRS